MRLKLTKEQRIAHRFLSTFNMAGDRMDSMLEALERAESIKSSITGTVDAIGGSGCDDKIGRAVARIDETCENIRRLADLFGPQFMEVERFISDVQERDPAAGKALRAIYINGSDVRTHCEEQGASKKAAYEALRRGLDIAFEMLADGWGEERQEMR